MNYEIQIFAKDRTKIIRFEEKEQEGYDPKKLSAWEDLYFALGLVIDQKADKIRENDTVIGRINVKNVSFDEVIDAMCEDLNKELINLLIAEQEVCVV
jgi:hypothetical protein